MAEHGPRAILHSPEVPIISVRPNTSMRVALRMECNNTSPKTIKDCMRKSAHFCYGRTRSSCNSSFPEGANY
jgi:hypothetical protein